MEKPSAPRSLSFHLWRREEGGKVNWELWKPLLRRADPYIA